MSVFIYLNFAQSLTLCLVEKKKTQINMCTQVLKLCAVLGRQHFQEIIKSPKIS